MDPITGGIIAGAIAWLATGPKRKRDREEIAENRDLQRRADAFINALDKGKR
jgi:hypothetical protein